MITTLETIAKLPEDELIEHVRLLPRKCVKDILLVDLLQEYKSRNGVYFFFDNEEIVYIGKASSRTFLDRIASHFDLRTVAFMANFVKSYVRYKGWELSDQNMQKAFIDIKDLEIGCLELQHQDISRIEGKLIKRYKPIYNPRYKNVEVCNNLI